MNLIKYLVCTSTLIEGVNLPCKSIFVRGPKKGIGKPMGPTDFWNLAGRAGRWGKEFQGNIICVDARRTDVWGEAGAPKEKYRYRIGRTSDRVMENANVLLEFIHSQTPREVAASNPELEYVFSFIVSSFLRAGSLAETAWVKRLDPTYVRELDALVASVIHSVDLPAALILRNPGISPFAMRNMLNYFASHTGDIDELIPVSADSESAVDEYVKILQRINTYLFPAFGAGGMVFRVALLVVDWMKGYPLARLITSRKSYLERKEIEHRLANVIRDVMDDVEQYARFRVPKYLACYCDLLKEHLTANGRSSNAIDMENLNVWLEFGVSQQTQLSMIGLGLSRSTAIALSELISNEKMSSEECIEWLQSRSWIVAEMPALMKKEIDQVLLRCLN